MAMPHLIKIMAGEFGRVPTTLIEFQVLIAETVDGGFVISDYPILKHTAKGETKSGAVLAYLAQRLELTDDRTTGTGDLG